MKAISQSVGDVKMPASIEQTDNAVAAPTPGVRDGSLTVRQLVYSYMAGYAGRDSSRPQRLGFWVSALGDLTLLELTDDAVFAALELLSARHGLSCADLNLTHRADPILTRGWMPTV